MMNAVTHVSLGKLSSQKIGIRMVPTLMGLDSGTVARWHTVLRSSLAAHEEIVLMTRASWPVLGKVAFVVTDQRVLCYSLSTEGESKGVPRSEVFSVRGSDLLSIVEVSSNTYAFDGREVTFEKAKYAAAAADRASFLTGVQVQNKPRPPDQVVADGDSDVRTVPEVDSRRRRSDARQDVFAKYVGIPLGIAGALSMVGIFGYFVISWIAGSDDDETGATGLDTYAYDVTYTPRAMGSTATGEARFVDDAASLGLSATGSSSFESLGSAICNDLATSANDRVVVELLADTVGTTLEKAHYLVLSAEYNLC